MWIWWPYVHVFLPFYKLEYVIYAKGFLIDSIEELEDGMMI
jgi:hypothetical protein